MAWCHCTTARPNGLGIPKLSQLPPSSPALVKPVHSREVAAGSRSAVPHPLGRQPPEERFWSQGSLAGLYFP